MEKKMSDLSLDQPGSTMGSNTSSLNTTPKVYADKAEAFNLESAREMSKPSE